MKKIHRIIPVLLMSSIASSGLAQQVYEADNGITASGSGTTRKVSLGGNLTGATNIGLNGFNLTLGHTLIWPTLSRANDRIRIGGPINTFGDGQNNLLSTSTDAGATWKTIMVEREGNVGFGAGIANWAVGSPVLRISAAGQLSIYSQNFMFGNQGGPVNSSSLMFSVSNTNEFTTGASYPNGVHSYSIATILQAATGSNKRAPLQLGGRELRFMTGGPTNVESARITETGNLLIGTTTDNTNKLQVNGAVWASGLLLPTGAGAGKVLTSDASGNATWQTAAVGTAGWTFTGNSGLTTSHFIGTTDAVPVVLKANNVEGLRIGTNGNIGIGTQSINEAGYKLFVEGNIRTRKVRVDQSTWADYVFDKDYTLLPLSTVEKYIQQHRHLPDVPSAAEVAKEGLDLGDNQAVLLKKIEELTLYVIEQNKMLRDQQARIEMLESKQQNKSVKKRPAQDR